MALGKILRETREQQGYTTAQVAEATHMMIQIVEELEREDFHRIAAAIYGRGFVKLYAEFLGIDPAPLIKEFSEIFSGARRPTIATRPLKPHTVSTDESSSSSTGSGFGVPDTEVRRNENAEEDNRETRENTRKEGDASIGARHAVCPGSGERGERGAANGREYARMDGAGGVGGSFETSVRSSEGKQTLAPPDGSAGSAGEPHNFRTSPAADPAAIDDLFAPRFAPPPVSRPTGRPPSHVSRPPSPGIAAEVLSGGGSSRPSRFAEAQERVAEGFKTLLAVLRELPAAISTNFPGRWRSAPVLAGAAAGLVVILVVVIVALRAPAPKAPEAASSGSSSSSEGSGFGAPDTEVRRNENAPAGVPPSGGSLSGASAPSPARPSSPLEGGQPREPHTASTLTIRTVLPPPEPYVD